MFIRSSLAYDYNDLTPNPSPKARGTHLETTLNEKLYEELLCSVGIVANCFYESKITEINFHCLL